MAGELTGPRQRLGVKLTCVQSNEYRLQTDFRAVQNERAKLQQLIDNLNSVSAESEKTRSEEKQRMEKRVEDVQREM